MDLLHKNICGNLQQLTQEIQSIWDFIGYESDEQNKKSLLISQRLQKILQDVVKEENEIRLTMDKEIDLRKHELHSWSQILGKNAFFPPRDLNSQQLLNILRSKVEESEKEVFYRKMTFINSLKQIQQLLEQLGLLGQLDNVLPKYEQINAMLMRFNDSLLLLLPVDSSTTTTTTTNNLKINFLPSENELALLEECVGILCERYDSQWKRFETLRNDLKRIAQDIDYEPANDYEIAVFNFVQPTTISSLETVNNSNQTIIDDFDVTMKQIIKDLQKESSTTVISTTDNAETADSSSSSTLALLTVESIQLLEEWRKRLVKQKAMLLGSCDELRTHLKVMWQRLSVPEDYQRYFLNQNSNYKPANLEALQEEVDRCQQLKWEHLADYVSGLQRELSELCSLCYCDPPKELIQTPNLSHNNADFPDNNRMTTSHYQEEELIQLEKSVEQLRRQYGMNKALYDTVANYQRLWEQYLQIEAKMKDPAILSNRGGILLKTEKERKRLLKELPRVEQEVQQQLTEQATSRNLTNEFTLKDGLTFAEYVQQLWLDFQKDKEGSKYRRGRSSATGSAATLRGISNDSLLPIMSSDNNNMMQNMPASPRRLPDAVGVSPRRVSYSKT